MPTFRLHRLLLPVVSSLLLAACSPAPEPPAPAPPRELTEAQREQLAAEEARVGRVREAAMARFVPSADGTVAEPGAGLVWMRCSAGQEWDGERCQGKPGQYNWDQALEVAEKRGEGWRLPTQAELYALTFCSSGIRSQLNSEGMGGGCAGQYERPTILQTVFPDTPVGNFWTSTPHERFSFSAWGVSFHSGHTGTGGRRDYVHVRLVRELR